MRAGGYGKEETLVKEPPARTRSANEIPFPVVGIGGENSRQDLDLWI